MLAVARRFASSGDAAEDIVQNAFEKAIRHLERFDGRSRLSTWLHRIVVNEALMWLRAEKRRHQRVVEHAEPELVAMAASGSPASPATPPDALERLISHQRRKRIHLALATLASSDREVLEACALGGQSYDDYSRRTGIAAAAAKSRAFRARRRLRDQLRDA